MNLRRRPNPERVREVKDFLTVNVANSYGEEIVALRGSIVEAIVLIEAGHPQAAGERLRHALGHAQ